MAELHFVSLVLGIATLAGIAVSSFCPRDNSARLPWFLFTWTVGMAYMVTLFAIVTAVR